MGVLILPMVIRYGFDFTVQFSDPSGTPCCRIDHRHSKIFLTIRLVDMIPLLQRIQIVNPIQPTSPQPRPAQPNSTDCN